MYGDWNQWDISIHNHWKQVKRRLSSEKIKSEKIAVDRENGTAIIIGSQGSYSVTLLTCTCPDFPKRKMPCKHMYRLASELGILHPWPQIDAPEILQGTITQEIARWESDYLNGHVSPAKYVKILEALSKD